MHKKSVCEFEKQVGPDKLGTDPSFKQILRWTLRFLSL